MVSLGRKHQSWGWQPSFWPFFSQKLHVNERNWTGGHPLFPPSKKPDPSKTFLEGTPVASFPLDLENPEKNFSTRGKILEKLYQTRKKGQASDFLFGLKGRFYFRIL